MTCNLTDILSDLSSQENIPTLRVYDVYLKSQVVSASAKKHGSSYWEVYRQLKLKLIIDGHKSGETVESQAKFHRMTPEAIEKIIYEHKHPRTKAKKVSRGRKRSSRTTLIYEEHLAGSSIRELSIRHAMTASGICKLLKRVKNPKASSVEDPETITAILTDRYLGWMGLSKKYNLTLTCIRQILRSNPIVSDREEF